jgi:hypothetical protein
LALKRQRPDPIRAVGNRQQIAARVAYLCGAEDGQARLGRPLTPDELARVIARYADP